MSIRPGNAKKQSWVKRLKNMDQVVAYTNKTHAQDIDGTLSVAIVADDQALLQALHFALEVEGYRVHVHQGGGDFLCRAPVLRPDIALVDQDMLAMNGLELVHRMNMNRICMPVLLMANVDCPALRHGAALTGVAEIVEKPLLGTALSDALKRMAENLKPQS